MRLFFYRAFGGKGGTGTAAGHARYFSRQTQGQVDYCRYRSNAGELRSLSDRLGIGSRVYFAGYVEEKAKNFFYNKARVAVFPSLYEPFGIVALEGMAAGVPVVVADTGGLAEIITHRDNGLKTYPGDASSLASNIIEALSNETLRNQIPLTGL